MSEKRILKFDLDSDSVKVKEMLENDLLPIHICAVSSALPNNNGSNFNKESQEISLPSWDNKPILGYFGSSPKDILTGDPEDYQSHNGGEVKFDNELEMYYYDYSKPTDEKAIGLIVPGSAKVVYHEDDGLWWTECDALIWTKYNYKGVKNLLKSKKKTVSVEVEIIASHEDENGYEIFEEFSLMGCTVLGNKVLPGITGASLTVSSFSKTETFQKQMKALSFACNTKNLNQIQKQINTKLSSKSNNSEEDIYHTNHPQEPENEDWKEISFDDEDKDDDNTSKENNSKEDNLRKEEKSQMNFSLSYNTRRELLDSALQEAINTSFIGDRKYGWVMDFDDETVYFYLDVDGYEGNWCAPYTLLLGEENGQEKVLDCTIDFENKEQVIREWKKLSANENSETEGKNNMNKDINSEKDKETQAQNFTDDRVSEAPKSGDDRGVPAQHNGPDDRNDPHPPATYVDDENKEDKDKDKENEACGDKENEAKDVTEVKSQPAGGDKEVTAVPSKSVNSDDSHDDDHDDKDDKCDCAKDDKEDCACKENEAKDDKDSKEDKDTKEDKKENEACDDKDKECKMSNESYEAKFAQLSADYVAMQKENETLKTINAKFEADIADLMAKVSKFEAEKNEAVNTNLYNFGLNMINAETDLAEDIRKTMSAELETECKASKFASEDEVKKFTITKIAMALYENRKNNVGSKTEPKKNDFVQNIVKPTPQVNKLAESRKALEALDSEEDG